MAQVGKVTRSMGIAAIAAAVLVAACGNGDTTTTAGGPLPLPIGDGSGARDSALAAEADDSPATTMIWPAIEFVAGEGLDGMGGNRSAYQISRDNGQLDLLAERLDTEIQDYSDPASLDLPVEPDVPVSDRSTEEAEAARAEGRAPLRPSSTLSTSDGVAWNYWNPDGEQGMAVATCDSDGECRDNNALAPETTTDGEAEAVARELLDGIGPGLDDADVAVRPAWGVWNVTVEYKLDGEAVSGFAAVVAVGDRSQIVSATGFAGEIGALGAYPTVTTDDAIDRMNDGWYTMPGDEAIAPMPWIADDTPAVAAEPAPQTTVPQTTTDESGDAIEPEQGQAVPLPPPSTTPEDGAVAEDIQRRLEDELSHTESGQAEQVSPQPDDGLVPPPDEMPPTEGGREPMPPEQLELPEPKTVTLTDVEWSLTVFHAWDGSGVYVVPSYTFAGDDGNEYSVLAVTDDMIAPPEFTPVDDGDVPADSGTSSGSSWGGGSSGSSGKADGREPATEMDTTTSAP